MILFTFYSISLFQWGKIALPNASYFLVSFLSIQTTGIRPYLFSKLQIHLCQQKKGKVSDLMPVKTESKESALVSAKTLKPICNLISTSRWSAL